MAGAENLYLTFGLMAISNEVLELVVKKKVGTDRS
jgi:hypothetical protein